MQTSRAERVHSRGLAAASRSVRCACGCAASSCAIASERARRSSGVSNRAFSGESSSRSSTAGVSSTAASRSTRNSQCHTAQAECALELQQRTRQRRADNPGHGGGRHEQRHGLAALARREPVRQVKDDAGEEPRLGGAKQKAQRAVQHVGVGHEHHGHGEHAPREHDPRDPHARAQPRQRQVARHLQQEIGDEEHQPDAVDRGAEARGSRFISSAANPTFTRSR